MKTIEKIDEFTGDYGISINKLSKKVEKERAKDMKKAEKWHGEIEQLFANLLGMLSRYNSKGLRAHGGALVKASSSVAQLVGAIETAMSREE